VSETKIDLAAARRVLETVDAGLCSGLGEPVPGQMCVEAAVCFALGMPHGDKPECVAAEDRAAISLNDARWSSARARAVGLRRVAVMQLGTAGMDRTEWTRIVVELTIRRIVPEALRAAARHGPSHAKALEDAAVRCERDGNEAAAWNARDVARAAAAYEAADAVVDALVASTLTTHLAAAYAVSAAERGVGVCDRVLLITARILEEAYERTGSPGLDLLREIEESPR
jgi:hypothetical protein